MVDLVRILPQYAYDSTASCTIHLKMRGSHYKHLECRVFQWKCISPSKDHVILTLQVQTLIGILQSLLDFDDKNGVVNEASGYFSAFELYESSFVTN